MNFVELPVFTKYLDNYITIEEYYKLQLFLAMHPNFGDLMPKSGGLRKLRWGAKGKGKRGGVRVIYYYYVKKSEITFMLIYSKKEMSNISAEMLKRLRKELPK